MTICAISAALKGLWALPDLASNGRPILAKNSRVMPSYIAVSPKPPADTK